MSTICAPATAPGGALAVIRVSGENAISFTSSIFQPKGGTALAQKKGSTLTFGNIVNPANPEEVIDEVLVSVFRAPHSYTGEDATEISCHGSSFIVEKIVTLLLGAGCRLAEAGEFTKRAFLNGKMDLSQAEAVADLIASTTAANHRMAMSQMRGGFSRKLRELRDELLHLTSLMELELDFSDHEELEFADRTELNELAQNIHDSLSALCQSFKLGNALKKGVPIAIVGETNAGKSTLLNALLQEERALVSQIHGTTRDTIEETVVMGDTLVRFIDTAGIRQTEDEVERMGIQRTFDKISQADLLVWMLDASRVQEQLQSLTTQLLPHLRQKPFLLVANKTDLLEAVQQQTLENLLLAAFLAEHELAPLHIIYISARRSDDIVRLRALLTREVASLTQTHSAHALIVSNVRHYEALSQALVSIDRVMEGLHSGLSGDFISQDLRECIHHLSDIVGDISASDTLQNIFRHFCIGK